MSDAMTDLGINPLEDTESEAALAYAHERRESIRTFVRTSPDYYIRMLDKIGGSSAFTPTLNIFAGIFGPIWFGARGLWNWALPFLIIETLALVQIARGLFGDLGADAMARIASIEGTLDLRRQQLAAAIESNSDRSDAFQRAVDGLEANIGSIRAEADALAATGPKIVLIGFTILVLAKIVQAIIANSALEARFSSWMSDRTVRSGMPISHIVFSAVFMALIAFAAMMHYALPGQLTLLSDFPTDPGIRLFSIDKVEGFFNWAILNGDVLFDAITYFIRLLLDALEIVFVKTPWIVIAALIVLLTWLTAGRADGDLLLRVFNLYGAAWFLGKGDDDTCPIGDGCVPFDPYRHSAWYVRSAATTVLQGNPTNHGLYADDASLRFHDPRHRIFWDR